tara:strand:+ start:1022 stop:5215 length:4194 start_codon:yes stop_codon:yes gene_type:complete
MASEIIINPAKNLSQLTKTDGTVISLATDNIPLQDNKISLGETPNYDKWFKDTSLNDNKTINKEDAVQYDNWFQGITLDKDISNDNSINEKVKKDNHDRVKKEAQGYFSQKALELKQFAVGDKAEWGKYWEIALGRSVANLMLEYHADTTLWGAADWETAFGPELEDTAFLEKLFLQGAQIIADIPTLGLGGAIGSRILPVTGGSAYGAGFLTESLRTTYHTALQRGDVDNFSEWWDIFIDQGIAEGHKAGATLAITLGLPKMLQLDELLAIGKLTRAQHYVANVITQWSAFQGMGRYYNGEFADGEQMALDGILFGTLGIGQSAKQAIGKSAIKENKSQQRVLEEKKSRHKDAEILYSKNQESFVRTPKGQLKAQPLKYVSIELMDEKIKLNKAYLKEKVEWETKAEQANERARHKKTTELDDRLIELDGKIQRGVISELEGRKQYAEINAGYEALRENKRLSLTVEITEITVDKTKSIEHQRAERRISERIVDKKLEPELNRKQKFKQWMKEHTINWWDKVHPVKKAQIEIVKKGKHQGVLDPYEMARLLTGKDLMAESFVHQGIPLSIKGVARGKGWNDILKDNFDNAGEVQSARNLLYSLRIKELYERKTKDLYEITKEEYQDAQIVINEASPKSIKAANEISHYQKEFLDWSFQNKYITKEMYKVLLESGKDYIPFVREGKHHANPFYQLKGSKRRVVNPITTIPVNVVHIAKKVYRNNMLREFFEPFLKDPIMMEEIGITKIKKSVKVATVPREEIARVLGLSKDKISGFKLDDLYYQFFAQEYNFRENNTVFFKDSKGKTIGFEVPPDLYLALSGQNPGKTNSVFNNTIFSATTKVAKNTITLAAPFFVRNIVRDTKVAAIVSKNNNYIPIYQMIRGIFLTYGREPFTFKKDPQGLLEQYIAGGGFDSHFFKMKQYSDPKINRILEGRNVYGELAHDQSKLSWMQSFFIRVAETSEIAAKLADFELTIKNLKKERSEGKNTMTDQQIFERALFDAKNLMDFSKAGLKAEIHNQGAMFFNARLRGLDKIKEAYTERPLATFAKSVAYTSIPYLTVYLLNHIDEEARAAYRRLSEHRRNSGYNIPLGGGEFLYIAGEWEHFQFYGAQLGAYLDWLREKDPDILKSFYWEAAKSFGKATANSLMPDAVRMLSLEQFANFDNFFDRPVVSKEHLGKLPEHQYTPQTSFLGKKIGQAINYSPIKIDKYISSQFNAYGRMANDLIDYAAETFGYQETIISPFDSQWINSLERNHFYKAFIIRNDRLNSAPIAKLWDTFKESQEFAQSYEFLIKGTPKQQKEAQELTKTYEYRVYKTASSVTEQFSNVYNAIKTIADQPNSEFKRRKDESKIDFENRIIAEKDATIEGMIESMIMVAEIVDEELFKVLKNMSKEEEK